MAEKFELRKIQLRQSWIWRNWNNPEFKKLGYKDENKKGGR